MNEANPRAIIGSNSTPYDIAVEEIENFYAEASNWCDGSPIETQEQADAVATLINIGRTALKDADERRKAEARPHDDAKKAIQERYNPLKDKADLGLSGLKALSLAFLQKQEAARQEAEAALRIKAEEAERAAREAMDVRDPTNLTSLAVAEELARDAKAAREERARTAKASTTAKGSTGRAIGLRTYRRAEVTDARTLVNFIWNYHEQELARFLAEFAQKRVAAGATDIPGVLIVEEQRAA